MTRESIKRTLQQHGLHIWQLCKALGVCRNTYYHYSHHSFRGHAKVVKQAVDKLISESKAGNNA